MSEMDVVLNEIKHLRKDVEEMASKIDEHIRESGEFRIQVHDNSKFRRSFDKHCFLIYTSIIGLIMTFLINKFQ